MVIIIIAAIIYLALILLGNGLISPLPVHIVRVTVINRWA